MPSHRDYAIELVEVRVGRDVEGLLRELYVDKRHTQVEIARALGVDRWQVGRWLRRFDITREDRTPVELEAL
jgi:hypothetical protein